MKMLRALWLLQLTASCCSYLGQQLVRPSPMATIAMLAGDSNRRSVAKSRVAKSLSDKIAAKQKKSPTRSAAKKKEPKDLEDKHLFYDEVEVAVRSGPGGHGAVITPPKRGSGPSNRAIKRGQMDGPSREQHSTRISKSSLKRTADNDFELPPGGGHGGDVVLFVDPSVGDLLHLRGKATLAATRGGDSLGIRDLPAARERWRELADADVPDLPISASGIRLRDAEPLRVPVPPGTFVRTKSGKVLGDLVRPGEELCVASGGEGGPCMLGADKATAKKAKRAVSQRRQQELFLDGGGDGTDDEFALSDEELTEMARGQPCTEARLSLVMRTVADVGFVGFPNAGKSTLLSALSRANPEVAAFPFTTLIPNLGAMVREGGSDDDGFEKKSRPAPTILADLPGLVEGAAAGKGLGRVFLRHLRRVRVVLYILDTSCAKPTVREQYEALRNELRLYNPQYLERPHVVALSKLDLPLASGGEAALTQVRKAGTREVAASAALALNETAAPAAIVPISGLKGKGMRILKEALEAAVASTR